jgi:PAS domain S-box-containing protein
MLQTVDRHGKLISVSGAWSEMMGYADDPKAPLGQPLNHFLSPETPMPFPVEAVSREAGAQWEGQTYHWQRRNGSSFEGEVSGICFDDPISNKKLFLMVITDVTARNQAMAQLQNANLSLADVNEKLRSFAYIASHDLQEPLRKLRSFAGHLRAELDGSLSEEAEFCLHAIERSALRLSDMVSDLLTFSREGNRELSLQDIDFDELLANIIQDLSLTADEADFSIKVEGSLGRLQADSNATRHLLQNILHNAIKYRDFNKKPELKVRISDTDYGKIIEFEDNGIGFEAAAKDKIFQPFLRLHGKSDRPGSGIGLAICKTVAERHGWKIAAHGIPNQGAVFSLTIPRTHQKEDHYK